MSAIINIATKAAYNAANIIQRGSGLLHRNHSKLQLDHKEGKNNFVTEFDKQAEAVIVETIKKAFPTHNILGEESGLDESNNSSTTWIIDPIDGTTNFMHGHPQYSISIGVKHGNQITHAVIFDPNRNDLYKAELGKGAFVNDKRLRVAKTTYLEDALVGTGFPTYDMSIMDKYLAILKDMLLHTAGHRRCGSAALDLAFVAAGHLDGFWEFNLQKWDIAAGYLLIKEAGGIVCDFAGAQDFWHNGNVVAGNDKIVAELLKIIRHHSADTKL